MATTAIGIVGASGTGKSTSLRNLDPKETLIISISGKPLPFKGWRKNYTPLRKEGDQWMGNYYVTADYREVLKVLKFINTKLTHFKQVIIDDFQYLMAYEFVDRATEKGFDKFSELAQHAMMILRFAEEMRDDCYMIITMHQENKGSDFDPKIGIKTLGRLLEEKITLEGMFTLLLFTKVIIDETTGVVDYQFVTNNNGECLAKTPMGMFDELYIPNDMQQVLEVVRSYENE